VDYLQQCTDLRRLGVDPELFAKALAVRYVHQLITFGGSEIRHPDLESALHPEHLESFLARAVGIAWNDVRIAQEWLVLQQVLPLAREAWEKGQSLFQEALEQAKSNQESLEYLSMIDFAVDGYANMSASRAYPDNPVLQNWAINGYMLAWREHFLKNQDGEGFIEVGL